MTAQVTTLDIVALDLHFSDNEHGYISGGVNGQNGVVLAKTSNSGKNWNMTTIPGTTLPLSISLAVNPPRTILTCLFIHYIDLNDTCPAQTSLSTRCSATSLVTTMA